MGGRDRWWQLLIRAQLPRVRAVLLLGLVLGTSALAGCSDAPPPRVMTIALDAPGAGFHDACALVECSWEWWNVTVDGAGWRIVEVPLPTIHPDGRSEPAWEHAAWARNVTAEGLVATLMGHEDGRAYVQLAGTGPGGATAHRVRVAGPTGYAEDFLRARWGPTANMTRPEALDVRLLGAVEGLHLTYEAHGARCERHAAFTLDARMMDGPAWAAGHDEVTCR